MRPEHETPEPLPVPPEEPQPETPEGEPEPPLVA